ncbi:biopolymer transporter ExbD [Oceanicoccus sp. KOV_DT_Chl]|uniref:ExbD/TolR family protein n=1 Tax=Oceanicoccus sp. KOV_DT_Chl TaxID=1904639 RepID=UPI000C7B4C4F|nr:biopolymer transporter ExbD [Oceanicoccus sp. KOV_DT_Chl]
MRRLRRNPPTEAELDITAFMNLMIVLVPVLLLGMVFSQITVIDVNLPALSTAASSSEADKMQVELVVDNEQMTVNFPQGIRVKTIVKTETGEHDFKLLSLVLQEVKRQLLEKGIERKNITILSAPDTDYQTIITAMDTVRSYKAVVVADVVDAALFPNIAFGDAPVMAEAKQ